MAQKVYFYEHNGLYKIKYEGLVVHLLLIQKNYS